MGESDKNEIYLSSSPHVSSKIETKHLMRSVLIASLPLTLYSIYLFSFPALIRIVLSIAFSVGFECSYKELMGLKIRWQDGSAAITGLFLALIVPPNFPIWQLILGDFFAIIIGKEIFGGLGCNVFNPALVGRAFLLVSFSSSMSSMVSPRINPFSTLISKVDALSSASPLSVISPSDGIVSSTSIIAETLGVSSIKELYMHLFLGNHAGCIGETSTMLILLGGSYLIIRGVIDWRIPISMIFTSTFLAWIYGIDPILTLTTGGLCFGAFFMATDYVTSPLTSKGRILFGVGCGLITVLLRLFSSLPEGVMFSILVMNALVPFLNKLVRKKYGYVKVTKHKEATK